MTIKVCIRGGGDLGSGVALRLHRAGMKVVVIELPQPLVVRRTVAFAEAVFSRAITVEGVAVVYAGNQPDVESAWAGGYVPVLVDPKLDAQKWIQPDVLVDARMLKRTDTANFDRQTFMVGIGPGFTAGVNCHAVIETKRGLSMGRVYYNGSSEPDTGIPEMVNGFVEQRVMRATSAGIFTGVVEIGQKVTKGQVLALVGGEKISAAFDGIVRGLLHSGIVVQKGTKVGDLDPRMDTTVLDRVSDKALAVGGGVLEAILSFPELRLKLCG